MIDLPEHLEPLLSGHPHIDVLGSEDPWPIPDGWLEELQQKLRELAADPRVQTELTYGDYKPGTPVRRPDDVEQRDVPAQRRSGVGGHRGAPRRHPDPTVAERAVRLRRAQDHLLLEHRLQVVPLPGLAAARRRAGDPGGRTRADPAVHRAVRRRAAPPAARPDPDRAAAAGARRAGPPPGARDRHLGRHPRPVEGPRHRRGGRAGAGGARVERAAGVVAVGAGRRALPPVRRGEPGRERGPGDRRDGALQRRRRAARRAGGGRRR